MTWKRIPVAVRLSSASVARPMGDCSAHDLNDLPGIVSSWGTYPGGSDVTGQFDVDLGVFEIIVHNE